jgi:general secretion pathway protein G
LLQAQNDGETRQKGAQPPPHARGRGERRADLTAARPHDISTKRGFTLMELLLVVLIIGMLAAMVVPRLIPRAEQAKVKIAQAEIDANLPAALDLFMLDVGRYPTSEEGLEALWSQPAAAPPDRWQGPYLTRKAALDPWGNPFSYYCPPHRGGLDYDLVSVGPDGLENTADDITNSATR